MSPVGIDVTWVVDTVRLDGLMSAAGLNSVELARRSGLNGSTVRRVVEGKSSSPSINVAMKIACGLGVDVTSFVVPVRRFPGCDVATTADGSAPDDHHAIPDKALIDLDALRYAARHARLVGADGKVTRLAFEAGLSADCVRNIFSGRRLSVKCTTAAKLASALGVEMQDILVPLDDPTGEQWA